MLNNSPKFLVFLIFFSGFSFLGAQSGSSPVTEILNGVNNQDTQSSHFVPDVALRFVEKPVIAKDITGCLVNIERTEEKNNNSKTTILKNMPIRAKIVGKSDNSVRAIDLLVTSEQGHCLKKWINVPLKWQFTKDGKVLVELNLTIKSEITKLKE